MADLAIKKWNGTAWETTYPETTVGQIIATGTPSSTTFLRGDGTWATPAGGGGGIDGSGTANQITYWVDADTLGSLTTATYPSLTELSRVKGVTSAIQTQINGKQDSLGTGSTNQFLRWSGLGIPIWDTVVASDVGAAATSHTHGSISSTGTITTNTAPATGQHLMITSSANVIQQSSIEFDTTNTTTFLRRDGSWATPAGGGESPVITVLSSDFSSTSTTLSTTGLDFAVNANKRYYVTFFGSTRSAATTTGPRISVSFDSLTSSPTVQGYFFNQNFSTVFGSTGELTAPLNVATTAVAATGSTLYGTNSASTTDAYIGFEAVFYGGTGVNKICTINFGTEVSGSTATLKAGSVLVVQEIA